METKTITIIGIVFLVLVIGGAFLMSSTGVATVGQYYKKAQLDSSICDTAYLYQNGKCLPLETGEPTYLDSEGCCRSCTDMATGPDACGDCLDLSKNCVWQTAEPMIACYDMTDPLYSQFGDCDEYCDFYAPGVACYSGNCGAPAAIC
jgi:hypothetical protein